MPLLTGLVCLALFISLTVLWWGPAFVAALQVLLAAVLLLAGLVLCLVGYSAMKAAREFKESFPGGIEVSNVDDAPPADNAEADS